MKPNPPKPSSTKAGVEEFSEEFYGELNKLPDSELWRFVRSEKPKIIVEKILASELAKERKKIEVRWRVDREQIAKEREGIAKENKRITKDLEFLEEMYQCSQKLLECNDLVTLEHLDKMIEDWKDELTEAAKRVRGGKMILAMSNNQMLSFIEISVIGSLIAMIIIFYMSHRERG